MSVSKKVAGMLAPVAVVGMAAMLPGVASAAPSGTTSYTVNLQPLNHQKASGSATVSITGNQVTVKEQVSGLAKTFMNGPFPHAQHLHAGAQGTCPTPSDDANGDGVVSTPEAMANYGAIQVSLTKSGDSSPKSALAITRFPGGSSYSLDRTYTVSASELAKVKAGGVMVVHGVDPTLISKKAQGEKSPLDKALPLAATAPALCGKLVAAQMGATPSGSVNTGGGSTAGTQDTGLLAAGGASVLAALAITGVAVTRRRRVEH